MVTRFTRGRAAVMTAGAGAGHIRVVEAYIGPARSRDMAGVTLRGRRNMIRILARSLITVMAGRAAAGRQAMVKANRLPV